MSRGRVAVRTIAVLAALVAGPSFLDGGSAGDVAAAAPPPPAPTSTIAAGERPSLIPVPAGCLAPEPADVAFVGVVTDKDFERVRFGIEQLRAGTAIGWVVDGLIDVLYFDDAKFLEVGERYLVGARFDAEFAELVSTIRPDEPLFGGNDVIGLDDTDIECPIIDDPVRTLRTDGTSVDSGVFTPFFEDRSRLLRAVAIPTGVAFAVLAGLVLLRWMLGLGGRAIFALGRAAVTPTEDERAVRVRRHHTVHDE